MIDSNSMGTTKTQYVVCTGLAMSVVSVHRTEAVALKKVEGRLDLRVVDVGPGSCYELIELPWGKEVRVHT
jgi:hypothetical protein